MRIALVQRGPTFVAARVGRGYSRGVEYIHKVTIIDQGTKSALVRLRAPRLGWRLSLTAR